MGSVLRAQLPAGLHCLEDHGRSLNIRIPAKVELEALDFDANETYKAAIDEVRDAEKAMVK